MIHAHASCELATVNSSHLLFLLFGRKGDPSWGRRLPVCFPNSMDFMRQSSHRWRKTNRKPLKRERERDIYNDIYIFYIRDVYNDGKPHGFLYGFLQFLAVSGTSRKSGKSLSSGIHMANHCLFWLRGVHARVHLCSYLSPLIIADQVHMLGGRSWTW